jgi:hypothetical protein
MDVVCQIIRLFHRDIHGQNHKLIPADAGRDIRQGVGYSRIIINHKNPYDFTHPYLTLTTQLLNYPYPN